MIEIDVDGIKTLTHSVRYVSRSWDEYCGRIFIQDFPTNLSLTKDFDAEFKVFTKSGKAKFVSVDDQSQFRITLDYEFTTAGPTDYP